MTTDQPSGNGSLSAQAPEFKPGDSSQAVSKPVSHPRPRRMSKSTAPDIATRIHEDIENRQYECAICANEVLRNSKIWSCRKCWTVFHLSCIKKWYAKQSSTLSQQSGQDDNLKQWRCPGCNLPQETAPALYTCWCEKEVDPKPLAGLPPHSCGQTCFREHTIPKKCPHPCPLICHAGACPPCTLMGPTTHCYCGRQSQTRSCQTTNYDTGWTCGQVCRKMMPCGEHACDRPCHEGSCGVCEVRVPARCYCGASEKAILCFDREVPRPSSKETESGKTEMWTGVFNCGSECNSFFDCGKHRCSKICHPQDLHPAHCPRSPDVVTHCPCGKTKLDDLSEPTRTTCDDPIPNCNKRCNKTLPCGHLCPDICHAGDCMPNGCLEKIQLSCRCGRTETSTICHQGIEEKPLCRRICRTTLSCGRHECGEHCCPGERKATQRNKRKPRPLNSGPRPIDDDFESEHICTKPCGRTLSCGNHTCQELCHKGRCPSCREAVFDEITCNCGRTVLMPPLPCGTQPPPCRYPCERNKGCGHPQVPHNCHLDDEDCPKCPYLVVKICLCGKNDLKNQPCWLSEVRCGEICGKKLKCGAHTCRKPCHKPGECEDSSLVCQQACGKQKSCGHSCELPCHSPYACKEEKACQHKIFITCACQHIKKEAKCLATKASPGNQSQTLKCDDECARLERNRKLALALNIDENHKDEHVPYSTETLNMYQQDVQWAQTQEKILRIFAANPDEKRLRFKPMPHHQRAFLHSLAEDFGFDSESMDPEPHRHVAMFKTPRFVMAPMKTLAECSRIRHSQRTVAPIAVQTKAKVSNLVGDPYNGFLLTNPRFALTIEEVKIAIQSAIDTKTGFTFNVSFLPSDEAVIKASAPSSSLSDRDTEQYLLSIKPAIAKLVSSQSLGSLQLCRVDSSLNILRREADSAASGWSKVAAKAATPSAQAPRTAPIGKASSFMVLTKPKAKAQPLPQPKVRREPSVVDDWEVAENMEEEKEKAAASAEGSTSGSPDIGALTLEEENDAEPSPLADAGVNNMASSSAAGAVDRV